MGNKIKAKELVSSLGIPIVPGYAGDIQSNEQIRSIVKEIGYPVIVKATSGAVEKVCVLLIAVSYTHLTLPTT